MLRTTLSSQIFRDARSLQVLSFGSRRRAALHPVRAMAIERRAGASHVAARATAGSRNCSNGTARGCTRARPAALSYDASHPALTVAPTVTARATSREHRSSQ